MTVRISAELGSARKFWYSLVMPPWRCPRHDQQSTSEAAAEKLLIQEKGHGKADERRKNDEAKRKPQGHPDGAPEDGTTEDDLVVSKPDELSETGAIRRHIMQRVDDCEGRWDEQQDGHHDRRNCGHL
jgi:hypothetical protein